MLIFQFRLGSASKSPKGRKGSGKKAKTPEPEPEPEPEEPTGPPPPQPGDDDWEFVDQDVEQVCSACFSCLFWGSGRGTGVQWGLLQLSILGIRMWNRYAVLTSAVYFGDQDVE